MKFLQFDAEAVSVNNPVDNNSLLVVITVIRCRQFIERTGMTGIRRKKDDARRTTQVPRIIPGDWGKVGPGWLAQPLLNKSRKAE
jgi:hypothetical protein